MFLRWEISSQNEAKMHLLVLVFFTNDQNNSYWLRRNIRAQLLRRICSGNGDNTTSNHNNNQSMFLIMCYLWQGSGSGTTQQRPGFDGTTSNQPAIHIYQREQTQDQHFNTYYWRRAGSLLHKHEQNSSRLFHIIAYRQFNSQYLVCVLI